MFENEELMTDNEWRHCPWAHLFTVKYCSYSGYVTDIGAAFQLINQYEFATQSHFITLFSSGAMKYDCNDQAFFLKKRIHWEEPGHGARGVQLRYDGVPFVVAGTSKLECQYGPDRKKNIKAKKAEIKSEVLEGSPRKRKVLVSKKTDCPACIDLRKIYRYEDYMIDNNTQWKRLSASDQLRKELRSDSCADVSYQIRVYIQLPRIEAHQNHSVGDAGITSLPIDPRVRAKIQSLAEDGIRDLTQIRKQVEQFVRDELFPEQEQPSIDNHRYFPSKIDYRNIRYKAEKRKHIRDGTLSPYIRKRSKADIAVWSILDCIKSVAQGEGDSRDGPVCSEPEMIGVSRQLEAIEEEDDTVDVHASYRGNECEVNKRDATQSSFNKHVPSDTIVCVENDNNGEGDCMVDMVGSANTENTIDDVDNLEDNGVSDDVVNDKIDNLSTNQSEDSRTQQVLTPNMNDTMHNFTGIIQNIRLPGNLDVENNRLLTTVDTRLLGTLQYENLPRHITNNVPSNPSSFDTRIQSTPISESNIASENGTVIRFSDACGNHVQITSSNSRVQGNVSNNTEINVCNSPMQMNLPTDLCDNRLPTYSMVRRNWDNSFTHPVRNNQPVNDNQPVQNQPLVGNQPVNIRPVYNQPGSSNRLVNDNRTISANQLTEGNRTMINAPVINIYGQHNFIPQSYNNNRMDSKTESSLEKPLSNTQQSNTTPHNISQITTNNNAPHTTIKPFVPQISNQNILLSPNPKQPDVDVTRIKSDCSGIVMSMLDAAYQSHDAQALGLLRQNLQQTYKQFVGSVSTRVPVSGHTPRAGHLPSVSNMQR